MVLQELLDLVPDLAPPILDGSDIPGDRGYDGLGHGGAGHGDGLLADRLEHVVDDAAGVRHDADLVLAAFAALRFPLDEIEVFHTDRGGGFAGERVERVLDGFHIVSWMTDALDGIRNTDPRAGSTVHGNSRNY